jgi:hypothetical protein
MDKSDIYGIYLLLWLILAQMSSNNYGAIIAGVVAIGYGIAAVLESNKEDKDK